MPATDTIVSFPTPMNVLADRIRAAYGRTERGRREWIEGTLDLAAALAEARARFPADRQFSVWIAENELDALGKNDRAALINMADDLVIARRILEDTKRTSWEMVWRDEREAWVPNLRKPTLLPANPEKLPSNPESEPEAPGETTPPAASTKPVSNRSPFHGWPRADEVAAVYRASEARRDLGKIIKVRGGKEIWSLILAALDASFLTATKIAFTKATLRILFPCGDRTYCGRFDLASVKERQHVRDHIMPAALANRDAILAAPDQLEGIVAAHWQRQQEATREAAAKQKVADALRSMPADQREVMMFGVRLWPRVEHQFGTYDYDQICAAIWYFRDLDGWVQGGISGKTPGSRAIIARLSTRWPQEYIDRAYPPETRGKIKKVYQLVHLLARLLEENPSGECCVPPTPKIEGQW